MRAVALALLVAIALAACDRNPYSGRLQSFSGADDEALADKASRQYRARIRPYGDAVAIARVTRVFDTVVETAKVGPVGEHAKHIQWEVTVTDQPDTDIATFPNGKIFVPAALVRIAADDAELATALGVAIGRVLSRHSNERMTKRSYRHQESHDGVTSFSSEGAAADLADTQSEEADWVGLVLATRAGYDPDVAVRIFDRVGWPGRAAQLRERLPELKNERATGG
jgi:predicted Zn-dependent protease